MPYINIREAAKSIKKVSSEKSFAYAAATENIGRAKKEKRKIKPENMKKFSSPNKEIKQQHNNDAKD